MFVKLGGNIWLVLTAVLVFPAMLYLTRQGPADLDGHAEQVGINRSEILPIPKQEHKQRVPAIGSTARDMSSESTGSPGNAANSYPDPAANSGISSDPAIDKPAAPAPRRAETYRSDNEPSLSSEIYTQEPTNPAVESRTVNTDTVNYYSVGSTAVAQKMASPAAVESPAATGTSGSHQKQTGSNNVTTRSNTIASVDNSILSPLYTAKIQQPQKSKPKCPPVYMAVNAYARNMRIAMGCNDNP
ncbi:hypothetical protein MNBD_GAMMA24-714 [hydrothermal vent metagenome]|uniref:Uncharacterized protein n=1 Tax=hydrothermal vent metagenome TaxID=652676 RepID=A0A3B1C9E6_9ZZZZ